uniref:Uncharacterized protein n=1 Tax=Arundo donax TaxID=35708 RepID=A0A0A9CL84_ARUDO
MTLCKLLICRAIPFSKCGNQQCPTDF